MLLQSDSLPFKAVPLTVPWFGDLLLWNGRPRRLTVPLLFKFTTEGLLDVVHVEGTDGRASDAGDKDRRQRFTSSSYCSALT